MPLTLNDYRYLYGTCELTTDLVRLKQLSDVCKVALLNRGIYEAVERLIKIPWPLVAALHFRETSQNFKRHLHNGDPLTGRTLHVPQGRPTHGEPPFTWLESALDALSDVWVPIAWDIPGCLEFMERYNGLGYQKQGVFSPYLWNFTNKYQSGLFTADGRFEPGKIETRPGCVAILKMLSEKGVSLDFNEIPASDPVFH